MTDLIFNLFYSFDFDYILQSNHHQRSTTNKYQEFKTEELTVKYFIFIELSFIK